MKKLLLILFVIISCSAKAQVVSNVDWSLDEANEKIMVTFDLEQNGEYIYFDISLKVKVGPNQITPTALSGDVGNFIKVGTNKKIIWDVFSDVNELNGELTVEVIAFNPVTPQSKSGDKSTVNSNSTPEMPSRTVSDIPFWAGMSGLGATGIGLLINGLNVKSESEELYRTYTNNRVEADPVYTELGFSREEIYNEANTKNKNATYLIWGGAAVLTTACAIMVNRIIQTSALRKSGLSVKPQVNLMTQAGMPESNVGINLTYKF